MPLSFFPFRFLIFDFGTEWNVSSIQTFPFNTTSSWISSKTLKTFNSQYLPVDSAFRLSNELDLTEWNSKRCSKYSIHSDIGIFFSSKVVFVNGLKRPPQSVHLYSCIPDLLNPARQKSIYPQYGQYLIGRLLINLISSLDAGLCLAPYDSVTLDSIRISLSLLCSLFSHVKCLKGTERCLPLELFSFFIFGGSRL